MKTLRLTVVVISALLTIGCLVLSVFASGGGINWLQTRFNSIEIFAMTLFPPTGWIFIFSGALALFTESSWIVYASAMVAGLGLASSLYFVFLIGSS